MLNFRTVSFSFLYLTWCTFDGNASDTPLSGGVVETDPNSPESWSIAWRAVKPLNEQFNDSEFYYIPKKINAVTSQVVAGWKYILQVEFAESKCTRKDVKIEDVTTSNCNISEDGKLDLYSIELWEKPWKKFEKLTISKTE